MVTPRWFDPKVTLGNVLTVVALLATLIGGYVNLKLDVASASQDIAAVQQQVRSLDNDNLPTRISVVESTIVQGRASRDKQNDEIMTRLDRMQEAILTLSSAVAGLAATIRAKP